MTAQTQHEAPGNGLFIAVWVGLLGLTMSEVVLAYMHIPVAFMLTLLVCLSLVKSALIMAYFMHLRFERLSLTLTLIPALVFCVIVMLLFVFPDSLRVATMGG